MVVTGLTVIMAITGVALALAGFVWFRSVRETGVCALVTFIVLLVAWALGVK